MKRKTNLSVALFSALFLVLFFYTHVLAQEGIELTLNECVKKAFENNSRAPKKRKKEEIVYKIKTLYYDLLLTKELIKLAKEVKDNFEEATEKSEEKLDSEDPDITQQDVLKLKLGLTGSKDELNSLEYDEKKIVGSLKHELGIQQDKKFSIKSKKLKKVKIELDKIKTDLNSTLKDKEAIFKTNEIYLKINRAEDSIKIARKVRKISRALLVTNLANFDFGIGEAKDLFEALFIYMRSVKNYQKKIHAYNISVAELSYETGKEFIKD